MDDKCKCGHIKGRHTKWRPFELDGDMCQECNCPSFDSSPFTSGDVRRIRKGMERELGVLSVHFAGFAATEALERNIETLKQREQELTSEAQDETP